MTISTLLEQFEKEFVHEDLEVIDWLRSHITEIVESIGNKIITCDPYSDLSLSNLEQGARFKLRQEQRRKLKQILQTLGIEK